MRVSALIPSLILVGLAGVAAGLLGGGNIQIHFGNQVAPAALTPSGSHVTAATQADAGQDLLIYQCGMHNPPYEQSGPGNCPLCGMPLLAVHVHRTLGADVIIDPSMVQNMGVRVTTPVMGNLQMNVRAVGTLTEPEQNHREINLR